MSHTQRKLNRLKAWDKYTQTIKMFSKQPIIKKVDIEDLKKQFATPVATAAVSSKKKEEAVLEEAPAAE
ncbi:MAG: hypothetical protein ACKVOU_11745 [Cytophagales bacterium]